MENPPATDTGGFKTVLATSFNGSGNTAGECNGYCIALPDSTAVGKPVIVCTVDGTTCINTTVGDLGPWCTGDSSYVNGIEKPLAEKYKSQPFTALTSQEQTYCGTGLNWETKSLKSNGAGIDLTPQLIVGLKLASDLKTAENWSGTVK